MKELVLSYKHTLKTVIYNFGKFLPQDFTYKILLQRWKRCNHLEIYRTDPQCLFSDEYVGYTLAGLTKLELKGVKLSKLEYDVSKLINLKHFKLEINTWSTLENIKFPNSIKYLDISFNYITNINNWLFPNNLVTLKLDKNEINAFENLNGCENLVQLDLGCNSILNIDDVSQFKKLRCLYLQSSSIKCITNLNSLNLEELYLNNNLIKNIQTLKNLSNLKVLNLSNNFIQRIGKRFDDSVNFVSFETLMINANSIGLSEDFHTKLFNFITTNLASNKITKIENWNSLTNLAVLNLSRNKINKIENLELMKNLNCVDLPYNKIEN
ncbi:L domain-like protein [Ascoidea rubescens DSM 1968]|uniref:L domain-like protein n=1 Tax=Ascoidea rubescens DSM 1968 TaxID=1344418 RepID=A0A1D2VFN3_9ASCO|nr:L domain-like protein [Ascoidea rubescens DSM 1968]ODV60446.1 L domain-like protein [Ascoidea rubescens DSM 1968]